MIMYKNINNLSSPIQVRVTIFYSWLKADKFYKLQYPYLYHLAIERRKIKFYKKINSLS